MISALSLTIAALIVLTESPSEATGARTAEAEEQGSIGQNALLAAYVCYRPHDGGRPISVPIPASLFIAAGLATGTVAATFAEAPALSMLLAVVTVPVALYAALATPPFGVPLALAAALAGVAVVAYWIYFFLSALSKAS